MTRFNEWLQELKQATQQRLLTTNPTCSIGHLELVSVIQIIDVGKYKFVVVGPKGRFAVTMDGTIYGLKNNDVNKKENYGNTETFEEFEWKSYYPVRKSLYDWQNEKKSKSTNKRTSKRSLHKNSRITKK